MWLTVGPAGWRDSGGLPDVALHVRSVNSSQAADFAFIEKARAARKAE
jgi:hypothetical protein